MPKATSISAGESSGSVTEDSWIFSPPSFSAANAPTLSRLMDMLNVSSKAKNFCNFFLAIFSFSFPKT